MRIGNSMARFAEAVERAERHWQDRRHEEATGQERPPFTIALSRETGAPATTVAHLVGDQLGWTVYDHELLERIADSLGVRTRLVESLDEKRVSWLQECVQALGSVPIVRENTFVRHLIETVLSLGAHGKCVLVGRGAAHLLPAETTLRVRLVAALEDRIATIGQRLHLSHRDAARHVETTDRERTGFIQDHFGKDPTDAHHYDLVLNASRYGPMQCAGLIIDALHRLEGRAQAGGAPAAVVQQEVVLAR